VLVAVLCGAGLLRLAWLVAPPRPDAATQVARWEAARQAAAGNPGAAAGRSVTGRVAARVAAALTRRGVDLTGVRQDLAVTGTTLEQHLARILGLSAVALIAPTALASVALAAGVGVPWQVPMLVGVLLAVLIGALAHRDLRAAAASRREEFSRSLSVYLDLVSMCLEAGRGHPEALPAAAAIGTGWTFELLQDSIGTARFTGTTVWSALGELGERLGVPELTDLSGSLSLAAEEGSRVRESLVARAATLRAKRLTDAEGQARQATESMQFALIVMVFAFFAYQMYPPIIRLFTG
jgi:Flp pilus assembly protein TadB